MRKCFLLGLAYALFFPLQAQRPIDVGKGFEVQAFHAPWDHLSNRNRFYSYSSEERFFFTFEVLDSTLTLTEPFTSEADVEPEDRVELFFSPTRGMNEYYCAEIDPKGRVLDYKARHYRQFDYSWNFTSLKVSTQLTPWGYRIGGSLLRSELEQLGCNLEKGFWMGLR